MESRKTRRLNRRTVMIIAGVLVLLAACGGGGYLLQQNAQRSAQEAAAARWQQEAAASGSIEATISATGDVEAARQANLNFAQSGTVTKVLVEAGDKVNAGQALAEVDATDLQLNLEKAQADLQRAQAEYDRLVGGANEQDLAAARAQLAQAQGSYQQVAGNVTKADIAAAQARVTQAQEQLNKLLAGPESEQLRNAESAAQQAQNNLQSQRDSLSLAKTNAELALQQAANSLTQAQVAYATASNNWTFVQESGRNPQQPDTVDSRGKKVPNKVTDQQRQQYYDTFVQAEAAMKNAEKAVQQAQVAYDNARQAEVLGIQSAEQQVAKAQADLADVQRGADTEQIAAARASLQSAQADLAKLTGANRSGSLASARAAVDSAQASLDKLNADPSTSDLAVVEASRIVAETTVKQAQRQLDQAKLTAPFAGTVAQINLNVGENASLGSASGTTGQVVLVDTSAFTVKVPVDELDVAQVNKGQKVRMILDALPDTEVGGTVINVAPLANKGQQGTTTYEVTVELDKTEVNVLPGMTASVQIVTSTKNEAVLVPRRAVQRDNNQDIVYVASASGQPDPETGRPASERRVVRLGLSNEESIEILDGVKAGENVLVQDTVDVFNPVERGG